MGYDDCECLACYCNGGGNNPCKGRYDTCLTCVDAICKDGATHRVTFALKNNDWNPDNECELCHKSRKITIQIAFHYLLI